MAVDFNEEFKRGMTAKMYGLGESYKSMAASFEATLLSMQGVTKSLPEFDIANDASWDPPPPPDIKTMTDLLNDMRLPVGTLECDFLDGPLDGETRTLPPEAGGRPIRIFLCVKPREIDWSSDAHYPSQASYVPEYFEYERYDIDEVTGHWTYYPRGHDFDT